MGHDNRQLNRHIVEQVDKARSSDITVKVAHTIPKERVQDLLITAFEGGSNYWALARITKPAFGKACGLYEIPFCGGEITFFDVENQEEQLGVLSLDSIRKGLQYMASCKDKNGKSIPERHWHNFINENEDAETADVFLQLTVMGEIVFG